MSEVVNMHQAKTSLSRLVRRALEGEEVVIARNGEPLVKLVPIPKPAKQRVPGREGKIWIGPGRSNCGRGLVSGSPVFPDNPSGHVRQSSICQ